MTLSFDELNPYGDYLRMETLEVDVSLDGYSGNETATADVRERDDPPDCEPLEAGPDEFWHISPVAPRAAGHVSAALGPPLFVSQTVYEFDRPEDAQAMLDAIAAVRSECESYARAEAFGKDRHISIDLSHDLDDTDAFAYGYTWDPDLHALAVSGRYLLHVQIGYLSLGDDRDFEDVRLINQAIAKFRAATP